MAQRMTTQMANVMASAMAVAYVRDMAHSTPLQYSCGHPSIAATSVVSRPDRFAWMAAFAAMGGR